MTRSALTTTASAPNVTADVTALLRWASAAKMAFWHLCPERLVVAVIERTGAEPLLHACVTVSGRMSGRSVPFAAGVLEAACEVRGLALSHAVYLDEASCRLVEEAGAATEVDEKGHVPVSGWRRTLTVPVRGRPGLVAVADEDTVATVRRLFETARLTLRAIDSAACAVMTLEEFLGSNDPHDDTREIAPRCDPLAAVSVAPECEEAAVALGTLLTVPVGGALERFGAVGDGHG